MAPSPKKREASLVSENQKEVVSEYIQNIIFPRFEPYLDLPQVIELQWSFVKQLKEETIRQGCIPDARRKGWDATNYDQKIYVTSFVNGLLLIDYRVVIPDIVSAKSSTLSIEIKPKAGYLAFSPLVDRLNRCKYLHSRFSMLQKLHQEGYITKGWSHGEHSSVSPSLYDPLDLFSNQEQRIVRALWNLVRVPQNNIKVWRDGKLVIGGSIQRKDSENEEAMHEAASRLCTPACRSTHVVKAVATILKREPFLSTLLKLQRLDILDADGAILLFDRFVQLCGGSHKDAEQVLDSSLGLAADAWGRREDCAILGASPFSAPVDSDRIRDICDEIKCFSEMLTASFPSLPSEVEMDRAQKRSRGYLMNLSKDECRYLLQNWLLSLTMADVSFFITLFPVSADGVAPDSHVDNGGVVSNRIEVARKQTADAPGLVFWESESEHKSISTAGYRLKMIDYDPKPASKLRSRQKVERTMQFYTP